MDHRNRDPGDNRPRNLREADQSQNASNRTANKNSISGLLGVSTRYYGGTKRQQQERGRENRPIKAWRAQIKTDGRVIYLLDYKHAKRRMAFFPHTEDQNPIKEHRSVPYTEYSTLSRQIEEMRPQVTASSTALFDYNKLLVQRRQLWMRANGLGPR